MLSFFRTTLRLVQSKFNKVGNSYMLFMQHYDVLSKYTCYKSDVPYLSLTIYTFSLIIHVIVSFSVPSFLLFVNVMWMITDRIVRALGQMVHKLRSKVVVLPMSYWRQEDSSITLHQTDI